MTISKLWCFSRVARLFLRVIMIRSYETIMFLPKEWKIRRWVGCIALPSKVVLTQVRTSRKLVCTCRSDANFPNARRHSSSEILSDEACTLLDLQLCHCCDFVSMRCYTVHQTRSQLLRPTSVYTPHRVTRMHSWMQLLHRRRQMLRLLLIAEVLSATWFMPNATI